MQQGNFNYFKEGSSLDKIQILEEKITEVIDRINAVTEENNSLNSRVSELEDALKKKNDELTAARQDMKNIEVLKTDISKLNNERETVKSQVENLIKELESVEL
jgi:predicted  nucleic acid-binding Zn-ribbon protein